MKQNKVNGKIGKLIKIKQYKNGVYLKHFYQYVSECIINPLLLTFKNTDDT